MFSIVIITSPSPTHPSTNLVDAVIESCTKLLGKQFTNIPVKIVFDGFKLSSKDRTKKGQITDLMAKSYELYISNVKQRYKSQPLFTFLELNSHHGFAHSVKIGLEECFTKYALVLQHDRIFSKSLDCFMNLIETLEGNCNIRYIGFPTVATNNYDTILRSRYNLGFLIEQDCKISINDNFEMVPLIFWYDSNHLCHVERYLQIFRPWKNFPRDLLSELVKAYDIARTHAQIISCLEMVTSSNSLHLEHKIPHIHHNNKNSETNDNNDNNTGSDGNNCIRYEEQEVLKSISFSSPRPMMPSDSAITGNLLLKSMLLKRGDFIEDKFGQFQRNCFLITTAAAEAEAADIKQSPRGCCEEEITSLIEGAPDASCNGGHKEGEAVRIEDARREITLRLCRWFGSYLLWPRSPYDVATVSCGSQAAEGACEQGGVEGDIVTNTENTDSHEGGGEGGMSPAPIESAVDKVFVKHIRGRRYPREKTLAFLASQRAGEPPEAGMWTMSGSESGAGSGGLGRQEIAGDTDSSHVEDQYEVDFDAEVDSDMLGAAEHWDLRCDGLNDINNNPA